MEVARFGLFLFDPVFRELLRSHAVKISDSLRKDIDSCVEEKGAAVVEMVVRGSGTNPVFEIFVDNEQGVTLDLCRELSRDLQLLFDGAVPKGRYGLTVSSPGLDRPLRHPWQFRKHVDRTLEVTIDGPENHQVVRGILASVSGEGIVLRDSDAHVDRAIPFAGIIEAKVKAPW